MNRVPVRVLVWAKSAVTRAGLEAIVRADERFDVVSNAARPSMLSHAIRQSDPELVLLDADDGVRPPDLSILGTDHEPPAIVALLDSSRRGEILRWLQSGVRALVLADSGSDEIIAALQAAHEGLAVVSTEILDVLLPAPGEPGGADDLAPIEPLTSRESEVLALLANGAGNREIATRLRISEHTVKFHVSSILSKLGADTRTEAVTRGYREGLILI